MSKRKRNTGAAKPSAASASHKRRPRPMKAAMVIALALCVTAAGAAALRWEPVRHGLGLAPAAEPVVQQQQNLQLSKDYVYAGGRLVATEEPTPATAGPPPTNLVAMMSTVAPPSATVTVTWSAPSSGTVASYIVERKSAAGQFAQVGQPVIVPSTSFNDTTAVEGSAYLYRVKAVFAGGGTSDYSNSDLATAVAFSDDPLVGSNDPQHRPATIIKATHLTELRRAVSAVHVLAGLGLVNTWTYPDPVSSPPAQRRAIYLEDMRELRTNLNPALSALGIGTLPDDATLDRGLKVKATHLQSVRDKVK